jgi:hypothetical protein
MPAINGFRVDRCSTVGTPYLLPIPVGSRSPKHSAVSWVSVLFGGFLLLTVDQGIPRAKLKLVERACARKEARCIEGISGLGTRPCR